jgi:hypothetical protein
MNHLGPASTDHPPTSTPRPIVSPHRTYEFPRRTPHRHRTLSHTGAGTQRWPPPSDWRQSTTRDDTPPRQLRDASPTNQSNVRLGRLWRAAVSAAPCAGAPMTGVTDAGSQISPPPNERVRIHDARPSRVTPGTPSTSRRHQLRGHQAPEVVVRDGGCGPPLFHVVRRLPRPRPAAGSPGSRR